MNKKSYERSRELKHDQEQRKNHKDFHQRLSNEHRKKKERITESTHHCESDNTILKHPIKQQPIIPIDNNIYSLNLIITDQNTELPTIDKGLSKYH